MPAVRLIGPGRAGRSLADALAHAGWEVAGLLGRHDDVRAAAEGVDLLVLAVPDGVVAQVAAAVAPLPTTVVAHLSGSLGLEVLAPHERRASVHPLLPLPDAERGAARLAAGEAPFAVAGDPLAAQVVAALGGRALDVADERRVLYHAAATVAANHLVALLGQVERIAAQAGVPLDAYLPLVRATVEDVAAVGPAAALTGPVKRGDVATVQRHLDALPPAERGAYRAMAAEAARLTARPDTAPPRSGERITRSGAQSAHQNGRVAGAPAVVDTVAAFRRALDAERAAGRTVGLVPTMGALHAGHVSLMRAAEECDVVAATVFVNPLQFGAGEDFDRYPRDLDADLAVCREAGVAYVFAPSVEEMYGAGEVLTTVSVARLGDDLEGASRPGHFDGVATVVATLFNAAGPCRAYFGEKDWQQLQIVRRMGADLSFPVEVVGCPVVRDDDGLALSSRNAYLSPDERRAATVLHRALLAGRDHPDDPVAAMKEAVAAEPRAELDYAEQVGDRLLIAARVGRTRLIDNMGVR